MTGNKQKGGLILQERDLNFLRALADFRVVDREIAKLIGDFHSTTRVNVRLLHLYQAGLLRRFFLGSTGAGSKALYSLSAKSAQLVGQPLRGPRRPNDSQLATDFYVVHQLAVNRIHCCFQFCPIPIPSVHFQRWLTFFEPIPGLQLIPDGHLELRASENVVAAFLEVDLGHERRHIWKKKVDNYVRFALSGNHDKQFGQSRFRVLVVANSDRHMHSIRKTVAGVTDRVFWFTTMERINNGSLFDPIWFRVKGTEQLPLIKEVP
ncbi:MAG: replication-relaxation family protein [Candidatus Korobacteraceae bacterium]